MGSFDNAISELGLKFLDRSELEFVLSAGESALKHVSTFSTKGMREPEFPRRAATAHKAKETLGCLVKARAAGSLCAVSSYHGWSCLKNVIALYFSEAASCGEDRDRAIASWVCLRDKLERNHIVSDFLDISKAVDRAEKKVRRLKEKLFSAEADLSSKKYDLELFMESRY